MPINPLSGGGGIDEVWGDFSGGSIVFAIAHPVYTSHHELRVRSFDASGNYSGAPAGTTTNIQMDADDLSVLLRALYAADTSVTPITVLQTLADHSGQVPTAIALTTTHAGAGTAGGASLPVPNVQSYNSRGADGSRWRLQLPGESNAVASGSASKTPFPSAGGAALALINYLTGGAVGPVSALLTNVVTHNGVGIVKGPGSVTDIISKRLRRRFGLV